MAEDINILTALFSTLPVIFGEEAPDEELERNWTGATDKYLRRNDDNE